MNEKVIFLLDDKILVGTLLCENPDKTFSVQVLETHLKIDCEKILLFQTDMQFSRNKRFYDLILQVTDKYPTKYIYRQKVAVQDLIFPRNINFAVGLIYLNITLTKILNFTKICGNLLFFPWLCLFEYLSLINDYCVLSKSIRKIDIDIEKLLPQERIAIQKQKQDKKELVNEIKNQLTSFSNIILAIIIPVLVALIPFIIDKSIQKEIQKQELKQNSTKVCYEYLDDTTKKFSI